jgi:tol-pal system protein YbgF
MRSFRLFVVLMLLPAAAFAQGRAQTLADIRGELAVLAAQFNSLKSELVTTGAAQSGAAGGDALQRLDAIEAAMTRLTAKTEEVELKLTRVVQDGTNRLGDLEFRLCELEEGCDVAALPDTPTLGGNAAIGDLPAVTPGIAPPATDAPELAIGEQRDFDAAKALYDQGDFSGAAARFKAFSDTYTGGPLTQEAQFMRGEALAQAGDTAGSARSYLDAFSSQPSGPRAGEALLKLGQSLGVLGQTPEACVTLQEVGTRFPGSVEASNAAVTMQGLGCQ